MFTQYFGTLWPQTSHFKNCRKYLSYIFLPLFAGSSCHRYSETLPTPFDEPALILLPIFYHKPCVNYIFPILSNFEVIHLSVTTY